MEPHLFLELVLVFLVAMLVVAGAFIPIAYIQDENFVFWQRALTFFVVIIGWIILTAITIAMVIGLVVFGFWAWGAAFPQ